MPDSPLFDHALDEDSAFRPEALVEAVRSERNIDGAAIPPVCVLDFDGDLTDWLSSTGRSTRNQNWACFHTGMEEVQLGDHRAGVVARTIGGPYAVLVAEQMLVSGAQVIVGLTSAGRVSPTMQLPALVVAERALRDEGTSLHYLPPGPYVDAPREPARSLMHELEDLGLPLALGPVWTTDAPYRETPSQIRDHAAEGLLAVEMQAASLFALAARREARIGVVAHMTNATDHDGADFDKGEHEVSFEILSRIVRAGYRAITG